MTASGRPPASVARHLRRLAQRVGHRGRRAEAFHLRRTRLDAYCVPGIADTPAQRTDRDVSEPPARFLDEPQDPDLAALYRLWATKRGLRLMPSKADFDPAEFKTLLSAVVLMEAGPPGGPYIVRLVGEGIVDFFGRTTKGQPAGSLMRPEGYRAFMLLLDSVVNSRAPVVRAGRTYWSADKPHKRFEALFLPLSNDDTVVNMILGAMKFA